MYVCVCLLVCLRGREIQFSPAGLLPKCWQQLKLELEVGHAECCSHRLNTGVHCVLRHHCCLLTVCISVCWSHEPEASIQPRHPNTPLKALTARPAPTSAQFLQFENLFHNLSDIQFLIYGWPSVFVDLLVADGVTVYCLGSQNQNWTERNNTETLFSSSKTFMYSHFFLPLIHWSPTFFEAVLVTPVLLEP